MTWARLTLERFDSSSTVRARPKLDKKLRQYSYKRRVKIGTLMRFIIYDQNETN